MNDMDQYPPPLNPEVVQTEIKEEKKTIPDPIEVHSGSLAPRDSSELNRTIANIAAGNGFPDRFDTHAKRLAAYNLAHSLMGSRWQLALNNMASIKGQLSIYGELPGALAEQTGQVQEKEVFALDILGDRICMTNKNLTAEATTGVCIIQRKNRAKKEFTYTLEEAKRAGQYPAKRRDGSLNADSPWMKFTKVMLMRKAMALAIKMEFSDALLGVPISEYDNDELPDLKDVTPSKKQESLTVAEKIANMSQNGQ